MNIHSFHSLQKALVLSIFILLITTSLSWAQDKVHPRIDTYGGIYQIPQAMVTPDPELSYKIVIDLYSGSAAADQLNPALNNVARMINLHVVGGVEGEMDVVLAIHGEANDVVMKNPDYFKRYQVDNPNLEIIKKLKEAGVKLTVCGQSLIHAKVAPEQVVKEVDIATSMLTTVTTYQLKGYAFLSF